MTAIDMMGLTDGHIAHREMPNMGKGWAGHEKHDGQYILSRKPTYLLLGNIDVSDRPRDPSEFPFNPYFSRAIANRIWANFLGVGLVEQIDDLRVSNPASNEALLSALADHLVEHNYDLKSLMRVVLQSETYQRSSVSTSVCLRSTVTKTRSGTTFRDPG